MAAATLTKAMLNDLQRGCAAISLLGYEGGVSSFASLDFEAADQIFSIKDSFNIAKADPSVTEIKIDQGDTTIDTDTEEGEWTISANIPTVAQAALEYFFTKGETISTSVKGQLGNAYARGQAFFSTPKEVHVTMMVESASKKTAVVFAHVKMTVGLSNDDNTNPMYLKLSGNILTNAETTGLVGDWAVLYANA